MDILEFLDDFIPYHGLWLTHPQKKSPKFLKATYSALNVMWVLANTTRGPMSCQATGRAFLKPPEYSVSLLTHKLREVTH